MTCLYLLRHAESAPSRELAEAEWPLSQRGHEQASGLVATLQTLGVARIRSSPYLRALDTIRPFARSVGLDVEIDERLRERCLSDGFVDDFLALLERSWSDLDFRTARGESARQCQARVMAAVRDGLAHSRETGETVLVSSHGNAIGLCLRAVDGSFGFSQWRAMRNPDLFALVGQDEQGGPGGDDDRALRWRRVALDHETRIT